MQVVIGMLGYDYPLRYSNLLKEILGTDLHQTSTLSDWSQRPLTEEQCEYALDDVRFFPELYEKLTTKLESEGRLNWVWKKLVKNKCITFSPIVITPHSGSIGMYPKV